MPANPSERASRLHDGYCDGQLLIAMPSMVDTYFEKTVIYVCAHSQEGAMGLIVNQKTSGMTVSSLLSQLGIVKSTGRDDAIRLSKMPVHNGGPVERSRGFVLHTPDYHTADSTLMIENGFALTATLDILKAIASGQGPNRMMVALGYAGWAPGQLEHEIKGNGWLIAPADPEIIFGLDPDAKYKQALHALGIDPSFLVGTAGRA